MPIHQFLDRVEAIRFVSDRLAVSGRQPPLNVDALIDAFEISPSTRPPADGQRVVLPRARWVVRNSDLNLIDALIGILEGTATGAILVYATGSIPLSLLAPAVAVVRHLVKVASLAWHHGVSLTPTDFKIICRLREAPDGLELEPLFEALRSNTELTASSDLEQRLKVLEKFPKAQGSVALVWRSADGRWRANDV
jgi:hypothetical protein